MFYSFQSILTNFPNVWIWWINQFKRIFIEKIAFMIFHCNISFFFVHWLCFILNIKFLSNTFCIFINFFNFLKARFCDKYFVIIQNTYYEALTIEIVWEVITSLNLANTPITVHHFSFTDWYGKVSNGLFQ